MSRKCCWQCGRSMVWSRQLRVLSAVFKDGRRFETFYWREIHWHVLKSGSELSPELLNELAVK